ncbi:MAG: hypothetical protein IAI50_14315 [Candidatus Eremiobacteraeota bacterium]|nr:hypothetical protein [Candidatus Eremiobacteraeota bacterium]
MFGHNVVVHTSIGKEFVGTLEQIANSASTVMLRPLPDDLATNYAFAINGVSALDVSAIVFMQDLSQPH